MTTAIEGFWALIWRIASSPSIPGIATSMRIMSGSSPSARFTASWPSDAVSTRWPAFSSTRRQSLCATSLSSATSTVTCFPSGMAQLHRRRHGLGRQRDGEVERRAVAERALDPYLAAVHLHDLLNDRQPEASPGYGLGRAAAHAAEALEDVGDLVRGDPEPCVGDGHQRVAAFGSARDG